MAQGTATVKQVLSGDTVVLMGNATNGPPPELTLNLASLSAPRLSRNPEQANEPFAWDSREFLRKLVIGKQVMFKVEYRVPSINRDFGSIWLDGKNVCITVATEGWARVKTADETSRDGVCQDLDEMLAAEVSAKANEKGIHSASTSTKTSLKFSGWDASEVLETNKGKPLDAVIESFRDGAAMRVVLTSPMYMINLSLAGVQCPRMNTSTKSAEPTSEGPAPFAREAKHFSEVRLLNRDVKVLLQGVDNYGNFFGTVVHKAGNISIELLKHGLGKMTDWTAAFVVPETRAAMRGAERVAKNQLLRLWRNYKPAQVQGTRTYTGKVVEVCSGDTIVVLVSGTSSEERRVSLSSIRAPRLGNARRNEEDAPFAYEAKEFLRSRAIGKNVRVSIEYERENAAVTTTGTNPPKRVFGTVITSTSKKSDVNLAQLVVAEGLAEVIRHRADDERSAFYDDLLSAEDNAKVSKKGSFSTRKPALHRFTDLTSDSTKARQYLPFLRREKVLKGLVEFVSSGTRIKVFIPKENCVLNFVASGIKCPNPERRGGNNSKSSKQPLPSRPAEPFGEEAKIFARSLLMQRNVELEVEDMDQGGTAFGPVTVVTSGGSRINYGVELLKEGLAKVDSYSVDRTKVSSMLQSAEAEALAAKKNIWLNYTPPSSSSLGNNNNVMSEQKVETFAVRVSEIISGGHLYVQKTSNNSLSSVEDKMKAFTTSHGTSGAPFEAKRGTLCAALFQDGGSGPSWFRAKIEAVKVGGVAENFRVRFIDYGNVATVPMSKLRPLDPTLAHIPGQATECVLAYLKVPTPDADYGQEAGMSLGDMVWGRPLTAKVHGKDELSRLCITLYDGDSNIGLSLVSAGLARIDRKARVGSQDKALYQSILDSQTQALKSRVNMWQYGDVESDDESSPPSRRY